MAEPFVFHFRRGDAGQPEQLYIADIRAECGLCRHVQVQRYYHATAIHPVTVDTLRRHATSVSEKTDYACPNCGTAVGPQHALSTGFTWAFPDDAGIVRGFVPDARDPSSLRWQLTPGRRLDPQELPSWVPDPAAVVHTELTDPRIEETFDRPINPKVLIREALLDWLEDPSGGAIARVSADMTMIAAGPDASLDELAEELGAVGTAIELDDCLPLGLPTHRSPDELSGQLQGWLPAEVDRSAVRFYVRPDRAIAVLDRAFEVANLTVERDASGYTHITTPRESPYPRPLPIMAVLRRAVYTGLTPGDAARLSAEEIVGSLLRVW